jgi:hypothetical protein
MTGTLSFETSLCQYVAEVASGRVWLAVQKLLDKATARHGGHWRKLRCLPKTCPVFAVNMYFELKYIEIV